MSAPATNCWVLAEAALVEALAYSSTFQQMLGVAGHEPARQFIFGERVDQSLWGFAPSDFERLNAYAQVMGSQNGPYGMQRDGQRWTPFGRSVLFVERRVSLATPLGDEPALGAERAWKLLLGCLLNEVRDYAQTSGGLFLTRFEVEAWGWNPREDWPHEGQWQGASVSLDWGRAPAQP